MDTVGERLKRMFPLAKGLTLKRMVLEGRVLALGSRVRKLNEPLLEGVDLEILPAEVRAERDAAQRERIAEKRRGLSPEQLGIEVVFEDEDLLIVNKPPGLLTSTVPDETRPTLLAKVTNYLALTSPHARVGLIHRLDRDARGLLVFTKGAEAYYSMKGQLKARSMAREYHAVVWGVPGEGDLREGVVKNRLVDGTDGVVRVSRGSGEPAVTYWRVIESGRETSLMGVKLETGRKHQIRVHMAGIGAPIVGDTVYGREDRSEHLLLAATRIEFLHPRTGEVGVFELEVPEDFVIR